MKTLSIYTVIVDVSSGCHQATFSIGNDMTINRQWDIRVTQYRCGQEFGGPPGCLQYFTGRTGRISSFNFPTQSNMIGSTGDRYHEEFYISKTCFKAALIRKVN